MRRHRHIVTVLRVLALAGMLAWFCRTAWANTMQCTTREDPVLQRWVTECSDGSQAVTRYDEQFKQWRTEVTKPGAASQAAEEPCKH